MTDLTKTNKGIFQETNQLLKSAYSKYFKDLSIDRIEIGVLLTAVRLSNGYCGVSSSCLESTINLSSKQKRSFGAFTPGNIAGQNVMDLFDYLDNEEIFSSVKIAVLSALSSFIIDKLGYKILRDTDPFDLLDLSSSKKITLVGAFDTYLRRIDESKHIVNVLELDKDALKDEYKHLFVPSINAFKVLPESDIIIITGLTLVNNTLDDLLKLIPESKQVVVVGPSIGILPDVLFKHNVGIIGSTMITDSERMFRIVAEAGTAYHLFHYNCAQKICLINDRSS
jgi:uncharacterized protein (DUF4213/DUF364 family)